MAEQNNGSLPPKSSLHATSAARSVPGQTFASSPPTQKMSQESSSTKQKLTSRKGKRSFQSFVDKNSDFLCPVCFDMIDEAYMTKCGHSFCFQCITRSLEESNRCPKCNFVIEKKDDVYPNFLLNELILKSKQGILMTKKKKADNTLKSAVDLQDLIMNDTLEGTDIDFLLDRLQRKKQQLKTENKIAQHELFREFLIQVKSHKQEQLDHLMEEMQILDDDLKRVNETISHQESESPGLSLTHVVPTTPTGPRAFILPGTGSTSYPIDESGDGNEPVDGFNTSTRKFTSNLFSSSVASRRKRIYQHFNDLETYYFNTRQQGLTGDESNSDSLGQFSENLSKFTRFGGFRPLATLNYASDIYNGSSIVSSIEFDRDSDYFAIAGVTKKIKVFEYSQVVRDVVDIHYPVHEMTCNSKISCISWSQYHKGMLASSDYEGTVTLWDAFQGTHTRLFQEHEKRCWSVDFNTRDPKLLASGSDDAKVKLWATNMEHSVRSLEAKANVCCVKFNPTSVYELAFGSADHCVHYYDLRNTKKALGVFKGHRKAVSYAKFLNGDMVVSASTDSQLKLWDVEKQHCLRTYEGHVNEKNFVGLASNGDYIACGSENNSLYIYYKDVSKQLLSYKFDTVRSVLEKEKKDEDNEFVSAVCWKPDSNIIVAANSQGSIKILELV